MFTEARNLTDDFFVRNYKLYGKSFLIALFVSAVFLTSEIMLIRMPCIQKGSRQFVL